MMMLMRSTNARNNRKKETLRDAQLQLLIDEKTKSPKTKKVVKRLNPLSQKVSTTANGGRKFVIS